MNKLIVSESVRHLLEAKPSMNNTEIKDSLYKEGILVSDTQLDDIKLMSNYDRELIEIELIKKHNNINY